MKDIYLVSTIHLTVPDDAPDELAGILAYMHEHCADVTLAGVAERFGFHPNTVSGMLKRQTGRTFTENLRAIRMERAVSLLQTGEVPVAQVAALCGYENPSNFYRVFKERFGCTPRAYRTARDVEAQER